MINDGLYWMHIKARQNNNQKKREKKNSGIWFNWQLAKFAFIVRFRHPKLLTQCVRLFFFYIFCCARVSGLGNGKLSALYYSRFESSVFFSFVCFLWYTENTRTGEPIRVDDFMALPWLETQYMFTDWQVYNIYSIVFLIRLIIECWCWALLRTSAQILSHRHNSIRQIHNFRLT